jgi:hypothetical protein
MKKYSRNLFSALYGAARLREIEIGLIANSKDLCKKCLTDSMRQKFVCSNYYCNMCDGQTFARGYHRVDSFYLIKDIEFLFTWIKAIVEEKNNDN